MHLRYSLKSEAVEIWYIRQNAITEKIVGIIYSSITKYPIKAAIMSNIIVMIPQINNNKLDFIVLQFLVLCTRFELVSLP